MKVVIKKPKGIECLGEVMHPGLFTCQVIQLSRNEVATLEGAIKLLDNMYNIVGLDDAMTASCYISDVLESKEVEK